MPRSSFLATTLALFLVQQASGGIPRLVNIVCEQGLLYAFGAGKTVVDATVIGEVVREAGLPLAPSVQRDGRSFWRRSLRFMGLGRRPER